MKKFLSAFLAFVMVLSLSMTAFAATADEPVAVKIKKLPVDASYTAIKLLDASIVKGEGDGVQDKYSYRLPSDELEREALLKVFIAVGNNTSVWKDGKAYSADGVTMAEAVEKYHNGSMNLSTLGGFVYGMLDSTHADYADRDAEWQATLTSKTDASKLAQAINDAINGLSAEDAKNLVKVEYTVEAAKGDAVEYKTFDAVDKKLAPGYYIFVQTSGANSEGDYAGSTSLYMLNTAGVPADDGTLTINPKVSAPEIESKEALDETDEQTQFAQWITSGGKHVVRFQIVSTLPDTLAAYETYKYIFHDAMTDMTPVTNEGALDFAVYAWNPATATEEVPALPAEEMPANVLDVTAKFIGTVGEAITDGCTLHIACDDVKSVGTEAFAITKDTKFIVQYRATVEPSAVSMKENKVHLEYSSNPYKSGSGDEHETEETPDTFSFIFTFDTDVKKVDDKKDPLTGAGFTLQRLSKTEGTLSAGILPVEGDSELTGYWVDVESFSPNFTDGAWSYEVSEFDFSDAATGYFRLVESRVPDGYTGAEDLYFRISFTEVDHDVTGKKLIPVFTVLNVNEESTNREENKWSFTAVNSSTEENGTFKVTQKDSSDVNNAGVVTIENRPGRLLPTTGGEGTRSLYIAGGVLLVGAVGAAFIVSKKSKKEKSAE